MNLKKLLFILSILFPLLLKAQYSIILQNNANIIMNGAVFMIVDQADYRGISYTGNGGIIADDERSRVAWNARTNSSTIYTIPFKTAEADMVPLALNKTNSGTESGGKGQLIISTYHTDISHPLNSSWYPKGYTWFTAVSNMNGPGGIDNSANASDRFWMINFNNYSPNPNLTADFTYDMGHTVLDINSPLTETNLYAQYWDGSKWVYPGSGSASPGTHQVTGVTIVNSNAPWVLSNSKNALPIELLSFNAVCIGDKVNLDWSTSSETNNNYFTVERSKDAQSWETVVNINSAGNSNVTQYYTATDDQPFPGYSYYRLKQTDYDGAFTYSDAVQTGCGTDQTFNIISVKPGYQNNQIVIQFNAADGELYTYSIYDIRGRLIQGKSDKAIAGTNEIRVKVIDISEGIYLITLRNSEKSFSQKILLGNQ